MRRFLAPLILLSLSTAAPVAFASGDVVSNSAQASVKLAPVDPLKQQADELDKLFGQLHRAKGIEQTQAIEQKIWANWMRNPSPTAELLLNQASKALQDGAFETSEVMLNKVIGTYPEYVEALNKRAMLYFNEERYDEAIDDLDMLLDAEPRHFGALSGKAMILHKLGKLSEATALLKQVLQIYPEMHAVKETLKQMQRDTPDI
jgi:tetratricopeptide (TPR) repeat protein